MTRKILAGILAFTFILSSCVASGIHREFRGGISPMVVEAGSGIR